MKIVFASNYFNHHQSSLCDALNRYTDGFRFIATSEMRQERRALGYGAEQLPDFVLQAHLSEQDQAEAAEQMKNADAVIMGSAPERMIFFRKRKNGLIFRYLERPLRKGKEPLKYLPRLARWHFKSPLSKQIYLLCASAYTAGDYAAFGLFHRKAYKWGYFTETKRYDNPELFMQQKSCTKILWVARFLPLKHPEMILEVARRLKADGFRFEMDLIGRGELETAIRQKISDYDLRDCVHLLGPMKPEQVRLHMESAGIFLATSDKREGWGAVVNEAMNSGCAVVASHAMGSVPYLIEHEKNGLIFQSENINMLYGMVKDLLEHPEKQAVLGRNAYETITTLWNADVAAQRLINLSEHILAGEKYPDLYQTGPCSRAEILRDDWM